MAKRGHSCVAHEIVCDTSHKSKRLKENRWNLATLPIDIFFLILEKLPIASARHLFLTCKHFGDISCHPKALQMLLRGIYFELFGARTREKLKTEPSFGLITEQILEIESNLRFDARSYIQEQLKSRCVLFFYKFEKDHFPILETNEYVIYADLVYENFEEIEWWVIKICTPNEVIIKKDCRVPVLYCGEFNTVKTALFIKWMLVNFQRFADHHKCHTILKKGNSNNEICIPKRWCYNYMQVGYPCKLNPVVFFLCLSEKYSIKYEWISFRSNLYTQETDFIIKHSVNNYSLIGHKSILMDTMDTLEERMLD